MSSFREYNQYLKKQTILELTPSKYYLEAVPRDCGEVKKVN